MMAWMKRPMNQVSEYWYMGSMLASDEIAKKRIEAFHAVVVYLAFEEGSHLMDIDFSITRL